MIWTVAKKELRGYFDSAIAVIFLAAFLGVAFYTFFWREKFFARGIADLRPLFEWMPRLLIILVSALAMRLWADERRAGTLEVLLTLPIARWRLVVGKFVAGMLLIAVALGLTFGLPLTISHMGHLDWGPVIGGYLAALLLSAAYLSIGMCVSAATDNQIVAFIGTAFLCVVAYAVGDLDNAVGRFLGTGVRFESVARGVLDLRDLAYYAGIVACGIALNVMLLQRLTWGTGSRAHKRRVGAVLGVVLVVANAIVLVAWLAPVRRARIDLTQSGSYSLSASTIAILNGLDENIVIRGYFSEKTHPKIAPLVPQMVDLLDEYRVAGGGKVKVEIIDPTESDDLRREAKELGVESTPLRFATQTEKSVVEAYFAVSIQYGDHHAALTLDDLIQVRAMDVGDVEIWLKNPEYQITRTLKKTASEFASVDALFASMPGKVTFTAYITPKLLPDLYKDAPAKLQKVADDLKKKAGGKLDYQLVEPTEANAKELYEKYGIAPERAIAGGQLIEFYFSMVLQVGDRAVRISPPQTIAANELETAVTEGLKRAAPGFTRVVGLWSPPESPGMPQEEGMPPQQMPPPQAFKLLERTLGGNYEVHPVPLLGPVADDIEVLIVAGPANLGDEQAKAIDQFVMRGGSLIVLDGRYRLAPSQGLAVEKVDSGLDKLLKAWGITVGDDMVLDAKSESLPVPIAGDEGIRKIVQLPYPFFIKLDGDELSPHVITSGLAGAVMHWSAAVKAEAKVGDDAHTVETLLTTSKKSWLKLNPKVEPDLMMYPQSGFPSADDAPEDKRGPQVVALAITGGFTSAYAHDKAAGSAAAAAGSAADERLIAHSPPDTRVVVFGSSAFVSDDIQQLSQQLESDLALSDLELVHNAVDWTLVDTDLLAIRANNSAAHALTIEADSAGSWRNANLIIGGLLLAGVTGFAWFRRRSVRPVVEPTPPTARTKESA